jgi:hypothetical protein
MVNSKAIVQILAEVPDGLIRDFLQHVRTFDAGHPGCHFRIQISSHGEESAEPIASMLEGLDPPIPIVGIIPLRDTTP